MIAPRATGAFVCLRCELQSARARVLVRLPGRLPRASFSASALHRNDLDELEAASQKERKDRTVSSRPLGPKRKRRGKSVLQESVARLSGMKALGTDAEILVLRDVNPPPEVEEPVQSPKQAPPEALSADILASLDKEGGPVTQDEINKQLDSLRPKSNSADDEPEYITVAEYRKLTKTLTEGFNVRQLSKYFAHAKGVGAAKVKKEVLNDLKAAKLPSKRPVGRTRWYPSITSLTERLPRPADVHKTGGKTSLSKKLLVDQIVRNAWGTVLLEEVESPGEIELTLKPWQIDLLHAGGSFLRKSSTSLDRVANARKAKIEVVWPSVIRITAAKTNAEYAADDIEQLLQNTVSIKFHIGDWRKAELLDEEPIKVNKLVDVFSQSSLQAIGRLSGVFIQPVAADTLSIRALDNDAAEEAQRALIRLLPLKTAVKYTMDSSTLSSGNSRSSLVPPSFKSDLALPHRSLSLGRWTRPIPKLSDQNASEENGSNFVTGSQITGSVPRESDTTILRKRVYEALEPRVIQHLRDWNPLLKLQGGAQWQVEPRHRLAASFKHALFPMGDNSSPASTPASKASTALSSSAVPGLAKIFADPALEGSRTFSNALLEYRFVPSPYMQNRLHGDQAYPRLSVTFRLRDEPLLHSVRLTYDESHLDVLLPDQATDLSFKQSRKLKLLQAFRYPNVEEFSEAVCANIKSGGRLTAPSSLTLEVPRFAIPGYEPTDYGTRHITYLFAGIHHGQYYNQSFEGHNLVYSISQEGKLGRNGGRLHFFYSGEAGDESKSLEGFIDSTFGLVDRITKAAGNPHTLVNLSRSSEVQAARKLRREAMMDARDVDAAATAESGTSNADTDQKINPEAGTEFSGRHQFGFAEPVAQLETTNLEDPVADVPSSVSRDDMLAGLSLDAPAERAQGLEEAEFEDPFLKDILAGSKGADDDASPNTVDSSAELQDGQKRTLTSDV